MNKNGNGPTSSDETYPRIEADAIDASIDRWVPEGADPEPDEDTAQLPVLRLDGGSHRAAAAAPASDADRRAIDWVRKMEAEIERLKARWQSVDAELGRSEMRAESLREEGEAKDGRISVLEDRLQALAAERDELRRSADAEKSHAIESRVEKDALAVENGKLRARLQDLESYIEGRRDSWASLNARLDEQKLQIAGLEQSLEDGEAAIDSREARIAVLEQSTLALERKLSETEGRRQERDAAHHEIQATLERKLAEIQKLADDNEQLNGRIRELESKVEAGTAELASVGAMLGDARQEAVTLRTDLGAAETLAEHMEKKSVEDRDLILELQSEVAELRLERNDLVDRLEKADERLGALEDKLDGANGTLTELRNQCAVQELRIADLERELAAKAEVIGAFDRSAARLTMLNRQLHTVADDVPDDAAIEADSHWPRGLIDDAVLFGSDEDDHRETIADLGARGLDEDSILADLNVTGSARPARVRMFVAIDDEFPGTEYALDKPVVTIGRAKDADIRLQDLAVSRTHARIRSGARHTVIEDAGSKNGITVNSRAVERATLRAGDVVSLGGKLDFQYVELELPPH